MLSIDFEGITAKHPVKVEHFPAGEQRLNYDVNSGCNYTVEWKYEREDELITLMYMCNHIKTHGGILSTLYIPYFPNARMDRVVNDDEVFTLKYFCDLINSLKFEKVYINNPHSDVCMGLLNNVKDAYLDDGRVCHNNDIILSLIEHLRLDEERDILFYPDLGCAKKYESVIKFPYRIGHKQRDWSTGKITGLEVLGTDLKQPFNALIVDDISSYGGTFLYSAKKLKEMGADKVFLYVTHCENSILQGELINSGLVEKIFTTDSIFTEKHPLIEFANK